MAARHGKACRPAGMRAARARRTSAAAPSQPCAARAHRGRWLGARRAAGERNLAQSTGTMCQGKPLLFPSGVWGENWLFGRS